MSAEVRRAAIMDRARAHGIVRISELMTQFDVSTATIRRDLAVLAERGLLEKVHGAGVLPREHATPSFAALDQDDGWERAAAASSQDRANAHVGMIIPTGSYYFPGIAEGAREVFDTRAVRRALAICNYDPTYEQALAQRFLAGGSTGLLLTPMISLHPSSTEYEHYSWLFELPVPVVLLERTVYSPDHDVSLSSVRTEHAAGAATAVRHLARLGHRGVGLITHGRSQSAARVIAGWRDAVEAAGLDAERSPLIVDPQANVLPTGESWPGSDAVDDILDQLRQADVTAIVAHGDKVALALAHYARARDWRIPDDLSVIAYDNELAELGDPPLTAIAPPKLLVGRAAADLILQLKTGDAARHVSIEPSLVQRDSTSVPRTTALP